MFKIYIYNTSDSRIKKKKNQYDELDSFQLEEEIVSEPIATPPMTASLDFDR